MIIGYFAVGLLIMFAMEVWINPHNEEKEEVVEDDEGKFTFDWKTRIFNIVLWPITFAIILKHFIDYLKTY